MVLHVRLEVVGEVGDALGEERDLHLGRAGVALVELELRDDLSLLLRVEHDWTCVSGDTRTRALAPREGPENGS